MNFFEGLGIFTVALLAFLISSILIGVVFTPDNMDLIAGAWISGSIIYALTVVILIYCSRC